MIAFITVHAALVVLRFRDPKLNRPFRTPISIGKVPVLPILGGIATIFLLLRFETTVYLVGGGFFIVVVISQLLMARKR